jgi:energy-coupling factor transporter ATP-binding protein EcfA2
MAKKKQRPPLVTPVVKPTDPPAPVPVVRKELAFELQKELYQAFEPIPLEANQTDLYIDLDSVRGDSNLVTRLLREIQFSNKNKTWLVAGHKGCGKSTELRRLYQQLNSGSKPYFPVLCAERDIDTVNVEFTDVLIVVLQRVASDLTDFGIRLTNTYLENLRERLWKSLFSEVQIEKADFTVGWAKISASIKGNPNTREEVRRILKAETATLQQEVNTLLRKASRDLQDKGYSGLVVIFDSLDRIFDRKQAETLFVDRATEMTGFECQMVVTMPISLAYQESINQLAATYASRPSIVPMTKLRGQPPTRQRHDAGMAGFRKIVDSRLSRLKLTRTQVFDSDAALDDLILATGGQPTELMSFMQELIVNGPLPIARDAVARLRVVRARDYRWLVQEDWQVLRAFKDHGQFTPTDENRGVLKRLLDGRALLQYLNDSEWYDLNPIVEDIPVPSSAGAPAT